MKNVIKFHKRSLYVKHKMETYLEDIQKFNGKMIEEVTLIKKVSVYKILLANLSCFL